MPEPDLLVRTPPGFRGEFREDIGIGFGRLHYPNLNGAPWPMMHLFPAWEFATEAVAAYGDPNDG